MLAYYHYTTARCNQKYPVGPPGIEPGLYEPESHVLPVYYGPIFDYLPLAVMQTAVRLSGCSLASHHAVA